MPWCPKCKTEYKEGMTTCVDCGTALVDEQPAEYEYVPLNTLEKEDIAQKAVKYFEYSKIDAHYEYSEEEDGYVLFVRDEEFKKAKKAFQAFYTVELEQILAKEEEEKARKEQDDALFYHEDADSTEDTSEEASNDENYIEDDNLLEEDDFADPRTRVDKKAASTMYAESVYEKKSDKCKDLKSTAITFFGFGAVGLIFIILNAAKVITFINAPLQYIVMSVLFLGFIYVGINSLQRAKKAAKEAVEEEQTTKQLTEWLNEHVTEEVLAELRDPEASDELNFIKVMDGIKSMVTKTFGELDDAYLDYVTEEFYNQKFDNSDVG